ncbi:MAG: LysM peptidoglycan-binding domain-containing protein [Sedimenticola sp.]
MGYKSTAITALAVMTLTGVTGCNHSTFLKSDSAETESLGSQSEATAMVVAETRDSGTLRIISNEKPVAPALPLASETAPGQRMPEQKLSQPPTDIWERIRGGFSIPKVTNPRIEREIKWYASNQEYLNRIGQRATPYLHFIVEEVEKRNMPLEMALLPVVESAFQPFAYSPGRAAGLWQFIPATGKHYGLKQNWWYDGRRDVVAATRAALDYLQSMAKDFDGDYELALAGYNAGAGNVRRAIRRNEKQGKPTDYWHLKLPRETQGYVPKLHAIASVIATPEAYGLTLPEIENGPYFESVDTGSQLDLALAADMAEIPIKELYRLNPGFNRWATDPAGPHRLNLPLDKADAFKTRLAALSPEKRLTWKRYKIRSGDNLGSIARRHQTSTALLKQINKLKSSRIRAGKHLLIPVSSKDPDQYALSADERNKRLMSVKRKGLKVIHTVAQGDSLWTIARKYGVNHKALAKWNGMAPGDTLSLGRKLVIWTRKSAQTTASLNLPTDSVPFKTKSTVRYSVRKGDSLARIAQRFNVRVSDLKKWNKLPGKYLQPGQKIKLYVDVTEQAAL